jgi:hypothetical protein
MIDPHFEQTHAGTREGSDWAGYWDESNKSSTKSSTAAATTRAQDINDAATIKLFSGNDFYDSSNKPFSTSYTEAGGGQYFISKDQAKRSSFADAGAKHTMYYSRFNKSRHFCASCHDVSNAALQNLSYKGTKPGDGTTVLPSESKAAHSYYYRFTEVLID